MDITVLTRARFDRGMTHADLARLAQVTLSSVEAVETGDPLFTDLVSVASALGFQVQFAFPDHVDADQQFRVDLPPVELADVEMDLAGALLRLGTPRSKVPLHLELDLCYAEQAADQLWCRPIALTDSFTSLPLVGGYRLDLVPHLGDVLSLVRTKPSLRWPDPLGSAQLVPADLDAAATDAYLTLVADGIPDAAQIASAL